MADLMLGARRPPAQPAATGDAIAEFLLRGAKIQGVRRGLAAPARLLRVNDRADAGPPATAATEAPGDPRPGRTSALNVPAPDPQTLLLLLVQLDDLTLSEGMAAYGSVDDPLLPVGELSRLLELDIEVSPSDGRVVGRLGEARRSLIIDLATNTARVGPVQVPLAPGDVAVAPADIYVRASVLAPTAAVEVRRRWACAADAADCHRAPADPGPAAAPGAAAPDGAGPNPPGDARRGSLQVLQPAFL